MITALVSGATGQTASYMIELLLNKGYEVHGIIRRASTFNTERIDHLYHDQHEDGLPLTLHYGDLSDTSSLRSIIEKTKPDEIFNFAAQSHVKVSFEIPEYTADVTGLGVLRILDAARIAEDRFGKRIKFYQAASSEMFGSAAPPQSETTPFHPRSPYACAKVYGYWQTVNYREAYDMFTCNGILFNHESERRHGTFVTRKITRAATRIKLSLQNKLYLGNLDASRDWGFAGDYCEAIWLMMQHDKPDDYVIATGESYSVREFVEYVFKVLDMPIHWRGSGLDEKGYIDVWTGEEAVIEVDKKYFRPSDVNSLCGDPSKAKRILGWKPKTDMHQLADMMVEADMKLARAEKKLKE